MNKRDEAFETWRVANRDNHTLTKYDIWCAGFAERGRLDIEAMETIVAALPFPDETSATGMFTDIKWAINAIDGGTE